MMTLALTPRQWPKLCAGRKQSSDVVRLQQCGISVAIQDPFGHGLKLWGSIELGRLHMQRSLRFLAFL